MSLDIEGTVRGGLALLVQDVQAAPDDMTDAVVRRAGHERRRRRTLLVATGLAAAVGVVVATPILVVHHSSTGPSDMTSTQTITDPKTYGEQLISMIQLPPGGTAVDHAPARFLAHRLDQPALEPPPSVVWRWWTYEASPESIWTWLRDRSHGDPALRWEGTIGGDLSDTPPPSELRSAGLTYVPREGLPFSVVYGDVTVVVGYLGPNTTGVAIYANVEPRPPIPPAATVPTKGVRARITWQDSAGSTKHLTVDSAAASRLARGLNYLPKETSGPHSCPPLTGLERSTTVDLIADGHRWRAAISVCFGTSVGVSRDGKDIVVKATQASNVPGGGPPAATMFMGELRSLGISW